MGACVMWDIATGKQRFITGTNRFLIQKQFVVIVSHVC